MGQTRTIKYILIRNIILWILVPLFSVLLILCTILSNKIIEDVNNAYSIKVKQLAQKTNSVIQTAHYAMSSMIIRPELSTALKVMSNPQSDYQHYISQTAIMDYIYELQLSTLASFNGELLVLTNDGDLISSISIRKVESSYKNKDWYRNLIQNQQIVYWDSEMMEVFPNRPYDDYIVCGQTIERYTKGNVKGIILLRIPVDVLWKYGIKDMLPCENISFFSGDGRCLISYSQDYSKEDMEQLFLTENLQSCGNNEVKLGTTDNVYYLATKLDSCGNFLLYSSGDSRKNFFRSNRIIVMIASAMFIIAVTTSVGVIFIANQISSPINNFILYMEVIEQNSTNMIPYHTSFLEIVKLEKSFYNAQSRIQLLLQQVRQEVESKEKARFDALKAQINPHFLFNTLNAIRWKAKLNNDDEVSDIIADLSILLNESYGNNQKFVTLKATLASLESYTKIMKIRYQSNFQFLYTASEGLLEYCVPVFSLQPIVENSILHGVHNMDAGLILVKATSVGDDLEIDVIDNGSGINCTIEELCQKRSSESSKKSTGIGVINVHERVQMIYGKQYGLHIDTTVTMGAKVTLKIPKMKQEGDAE